MSTSPKRKLPEETDFTYSKKPRNDMNGASDVEDTEMATEVPIINPYAPPDSYINHEAAIAYWSSTPATVDGVLGGFPQVSRVDLQGSANFLAKLRRQSKHHTQGAKLSRAADCGAGIGRITRGFLSNIADVVDIIEPVKAFTDQIKDEKYVGQVYSVGLEQWQPEFKYDLVWNQWCVGQLTDSQLVAYLKSLPQHLTQGGWIVVKENLSNHHLGEDVFDETDSSVTRTDVKFRQLFEEANLRLVSTELQKGFPKALYPVRVYALQAK